MRLIYLDHTATTPLDPEVFEAMRPYFSERFGNASSIHAFGREARSALEQARGTIAAALGASPAELVFTSGGTEADNYAILGATAAGAAAGPARIVSATAEHHAVLETVSAAAAMGVAAATALVPVDKDGRVDPAVVEEALRTPTTLVSVMHANNEVGTINPVAAIAQVVHGKGALMHTDAVQSFGKIPVRVDDLDVDLLSISAHKLYGPKGIGALYVRRGTELAPLLHGGGQERGKRPGTENVPLAVGFAKAVDLALQRMSDDAGRLKGLRDRLEEQVKERFPFVMVNGHPTERLPHILNVSVDSSKAPVEGDTLVMNMDLHGVAVTSGSACTSGSMQPSHVLLAMGRDPATATATLRFSFGRGNREEDVERVVEVLTTVFRQMGLPV